MSHTSQIQETFCIHAKLMQIEQNKVRGQKARADTFLLHAQHISSGPKTQYILQLTAQVGVGLTDNPEPAS